jgi:hypothetical protein
MSDSWTKELFDYKIGHHGLGRRLTQADEGEKEEEKAGESNNLEQAGERQGGEREGKGTSWEARAAVSETGTGGASVGGASSVDLKGTLL